MDGPARARVLWCIKWLGYGGAERLLVSTAAMGRLVVRSLPRSSRPRTVTTEHNVWAANSAAQFDIGAATRRIESIYHDVAGHPAPALLRPAGVGR